MATLVITIDGAQAKQVLRDLEHGLERYGVQAQVTERQTTGVSSSFAGLTKGGVALAAQLAATYLSFQALTGAITASARAAMESEQATNRLSIAIKNKGIAAGVTTRELTDMASQLQRVTRFNDEAIKGVQEVLLRYNSIDGRNIERVTKLALDFATATGQDAVNAARALGRALDEPGEGMRALGQAGIVLEEQQKKLLEQLDDTGQEARAQAMLLGMLEQRLNGLAEHSAKDAEGAIDRLRNSFDELGEAMGGGFLEGLKDSVEQLDKMATSEDAIEVARELGVNIGIIAAALADVLKLLNDIGVTKAFSLLVQAGTRSSALAIGSQLMDRARASAGRDPLGTGGPSIGATTFAEADARYQAAVRAEEIRKEDEANQRRAARFAAMNATFREHLDNIVSGWGEANTAADQHAQQMEALLSKYDAVGSETAQLAADQKALSAAVRGGATNLSAALTDVEQRLRLLRASTGQSGPLAGGTLVPVDLTKMRKANEVLTEVSRNVDEAAEAAGEFAGYVSDADLRITSLANGMQFALGYIQEHETAQERITRLLKENEDVQKRLALLARMFPEKAELWAEALRKAKEEASDIKFERWATSLRMVADALGEANEKLGRMAHAVLDVAEGWRQVQKARAAGDGVGQAAGYGQMAQGIYSAGTAAGIWGPKGGTSQFGGQKEGNYATEGEAYGQIIGGIIGSFWGPAGTMAGMAIGGALGGIVGSFIKKGADEGLAQLNLIAGQVGTKITKSEGGLGGVLKGIGADIGDAIEGITAILGGELESMPTVFLKVRDDVITVLVNGVKGRFKEMDDAISFAVAQALKGAQISGLSPAMGQLLKGGRFESVEELQGAVQFLKTLEHAASGMSDLAASMQNMVTQTAAAQQQLENFGVAADEASRIAWGAFLNQYQAAVRQVTGRGMSPEEQRKQKQAEIAILNAQRKLAITRIDLEMAEVRAKLSGTMVRENLARREIDTMFETIKGYSGYVTARAQLSDAERAVLEQQLTYLQQVRDALAGMDDITMGDVRMGRGGGRGRGGGGWHDRVLAALEGIRDLQKRLVFGELSPFTGRQKVGAAQAEVERLQAMYGQGGRARVLAMEQLPEAIETYLSLFRDTFGATGAYEGVARQMNEFLSMILRQHGVAPVSVMGEQAQVQADAFARKFKYDHRGHLQTKDHDVDRKLGDGNVFAERTSRDMGRAVELLEEMNNNAARGSATVRPPQVPQVAQFG